MSGILDGIRVVDMSRYISGPYCAMMLADMGAEVIKVEKPGEGEIYRVGGPWKDGVSLVFQAMNRNKKSVTADTRSPEGLQLIKELILHSDVLIENFRAGVMENMRQDYIKFARAKGVSTRKVLFGHALKNALIPVITVFGMEIGSLIAFTTVTETIYSWPGLGKLLIDSINSVDRPVIVAYLILTTVLFVFINFVVDLLYTVIDPRIKIR